MSILVRDKFHNIVGHFFIEEDEDQLKKLEGMCMIIPNALKGRGTLDDMIKYSYQLLSRAEIAETKLREVEKAEAELKLEIQTLKVFKRDAKEILEQKIADLFGP